MLSIAEWHELFNYIFAMFFGILLTTLFIHQIVTRIKNKKKMKRNQQIIRIGLKILKNVY